MGEVAGLTTIADLMRHERAAEQIAAAEGHVTKGMSGEQVLALADKAIPGTRLGGELGQRLWSNLGVKSATQKETTFPDAPYAYVMLGLFCACARHGLTIDEITEPEPGGHAVVAATVPSSLLAFAGQILLDVRSAERQGFTVTGHTIFKGQMFDWGRGGRLLDEVMDRTAQSIRTFTTLDL